MQGSIVDKTACMDIVNAAGCRDCIIVADKGFYSTQNVSALLRAGMKYILPLSEDNVNVKSAFLNHVSLIYYVRFKVSVFGLV